ncbi:hypothetical protein SDRG_10171 [Saprolegnia diclina VS20]|uniref:Globin domain-containing protein n=1 Tax=Saprolegnia diclina (strain VS20) TaxID=1156394 RepID=T0RQQ6_SAPDV|nr:hypothetical protein SDRG_10171 [Saprolegnia diclina VS20]EQC32432.1 hypothetical protein SDRG_10171 [Saprolegnia diclina VS20]|eukprot:XP_008614373.1 hypothetical protein SDRG_10171 [Saprolegnia diclina VS20]
MGLTKSKVEAPPVAPASGPTLGATQPSTVTKGGAKKSKKAASTVDDGNEAPKHVDDDTGEMIQLFMYERCPRSIVHHYIPANLPMMPLFTAAYVSDCNNTWKYILGSATDRMKEFRKSGIILFYDEFFFRLFQRDSTFQEVFPDVKRRGEILIKALTLMLKCSTEDNARLVNKIRYLGHRHRFFPKIRAYQFATYTSTMIEVLMYWLGELATPDIAEAWSNVVCFFMKHMLESFLTNRVDPYESYQNTIIEHMRALSEIEQDDASNKPSSSRSSRVSRQSVAR